jgi:hypothetical protein
VNVMDVVRVRPTLFLICEENPQIGSCGSGTGHGRFVQSEILKLHKSGQFPDVRVIIVVSSILSDLVSGSQFYTFGCCH